MKLSRIFESCLVAWQSNKLNKTCINRSHIGLVSVRERAHVHAHTLNETCKLGKVTSKIYSSKFRPYYSKIADKGMIIKV